MIREFKTYYVQCDICDEWLRYPDDFVLEYKRQNKVEEAKEIDIIDAAEMFGWKNIDDSWRCTDCINY